MGTQEGLMTLRCLFPPVSFQLVLRFASHYLKVLDGWTEAYGLRGQWSIAGVSPLAFDVDAQSDAGSAAAVVEPSKSFDDPG
jgi:hypothetical protein